MQPRRSGFTLIELLVVMVIIGLLAVIAVPNFWKTRERAYYQAMKSDLKNFVAAQEIYFSSNNHVYGGSAGQHGDAISGLEFNTSAGVTVTVREATTQGWSAEATHAGLNPSSEKCAVYIGNASALSPANSVGLITCTGE